MNLIYFQIISKKAWESESFPRKKMRIPRTLRLSKALNSLVKDSGVLKFLRRFSKELLRVS